MLGYSLPNNDIGIFFEGDQIKKMEKKTIKGKYFNYQNLDVVGVLLASVRDDLPERIIISIDRNAESLVSKMHLKMRPNEYHSFRERGSFGVHEGFRHVDLFDANRLEGLDACSYSQLKLYEKTYPRKVA